VKHQFSPKRQDFMAQVIARLPLNYRSFEENVGFSDDPAYFTDIVFGFLEEQEVSPDGSCASGGEYNEEDEDEISPCNVEENKKFWDEQNQLLQVNFHPFFPIYNVSRLMLRSLLD
jgi:hypothetical protein